MLKIAMVQLTRTPYFLCNSRGIEVPSAICGEGTHVAEVPSTIERYLCGLQMV